LAVAALAAALRIYTLEPPQRRPRPHYQTSNGQRSRTVVSQRRVNAHEYPGDDIGTKINNAAKALGSGGGRLI